MKIFNGAYRADLIPNEVKRGVVHLLKHHDLLLDLLVQTIHDA